MPRNSSYSPEVRERAVRMVLEHRQDYPSVWATMGAVASRLGITTGTLRKWVRHAENEAPGSRNLRRSDNATR